MVQVEQTSLGVLAVSGDDSFPQLLGGSFDSSTDAGIGSAAADIPHTLIDVCIGRARVVAEHGRSRHHLSDLAVAALRHAVLFPRFLNRVGTIGRETFDGDDLRIANLAQSSNTGLPRCAIDVNGTGSALGYATPVFGPGQTQVIP